MTRAIGALLLLTAGSAAAASPSPQDFAYGSRVETQGRAAIYRLDLPRAVYDHAVRPDLGDLRVFNGAGEVVPHALRRPEAPAGAAPPPQALPFFPLETTTTGNGARVSVKVVTDARGAVVDVGGGAALEPGHRVSLYLIDAGSLKQPPAELELDWSGGPDSLVAGVEVSGSDDLAHWETLTAGASLARLVYAGQVLERRTLPLSPRPYRYLRLSWPAAFGTAQLKGANARFARPGGTPALHWAEIAGKAVDKDVTAFEYQYPGAIPAERVDLALSQDNSLVEGTLLSRPDAKSPWRPRYRGTFYRLQVQGTSLASPPATIQPLADRYWRLEVKSDPAGLGGRPPRLHLGWPSHGLYFLARGDGPYTLAFGNGSAAPPAEGVSNLLARIDDAQSSTFIAPAAAGKPFILGDPDRLKPKPKPLPWQRIILWGVLVLGVLLLAGMAWRLYRQMAKGSPR